MGNLEYPDREATLHEAQQRRKRKSKRKPNGAAGSSALLLRDAILAAEDIRCERVAMPEWGVTVEVRTLTLAQREAFEAAAGEIDLDSDNATNIARVVAMATFGPDGERVFAVGDIPALAAKASKPLSRLFNVVDRLNSLTEGRTEVLTKN